MESVLHVPKNKILVESDSENLLDAVSVANGIMALRDDVSIDDIYTNAIGVFYNG